MVNYLQGLLTDLSPVEAAVTLVFREEGRGFPSKISEPARSCKIECSYVKPHCLNSFNTENCTVATDGTF